MLKTVLIVVLIGIVAFEVIEHIVLPLVFAVFARKRRAVTGSEGMLGRVVEVACWHGGAGTVRCGGELWSATSVHCFAPGDKAIVRRTDGLCLSITPVDNAGGQRLDDQRRP
jgi:membrane-bound ClpP family serine protease